MVLLPPREKPHILVTHDESFFNSNDDQRNLWIEKGKQPIQPKENARELWFPTSQQEVV